MAEAGTELDHTINSLLFLFLQGSCAACKPLGKVTCESSKTSSIVQDFLRKPEREDVGQEVLDQHICEQSRTMNIQFKAPMRACKQHLRGDRVCQKGQTAEDILM